MMKIVKIDLIMEKMGISLEHMLSNVIQLWLYLMWSHDFRNPFRFQYPVMQQKLELSLIFKIFIHTNSRLTFLWSFYKEFKIKNEWIAERLDFFSGTNVVKTVKNVDAARRRVVNLFWTALNASDQSAKTRKITWKRRKICSFLFLPRAIFFQKFESIYSEWLNEVSLSNSKFECGI